MKLYYLLLLVALSSFPPCLYSNESHDATEQDTEELTMSSGAIFPITYLQLKEVFQGPCKEPSQDIIPDDAAHLRFKDGSVWQVSDHDADEVKKWKANHILTISRNWNNTPSWFHNYSPFYYVIHNITTRTHVEAHLKILNDPSQDVMHAFAGCTAKNYIKLANGTYWTTSDSDLQRIQEQWKPGDRILVAHEMKGFGFGHPNVLLNLSQNDSCPATWLRY